MCRDAVFNVMLFGLCKSPGTIQRLMDGIVRNEIGKDLADYLVDLLMYVLVHAEMVPIFDRTLGQRIDSP